MPADDTPSHPLLKVYNDIGKITKGIQGLEKGQDKLDKGQQELHKTVANMVTVDECDARHGELDERVEAVEECAGAAKQKVKEVTKRGLFGRLADNAGDITKIATLLILAGAGLWALHKFVTRVETALARTSGEQAQATQQLIRRLDTPHEPQVVYIPVTIKPDAGIRRPRRRRPRRATPRKRATP